jgi:hypothetical protein
MHAADPSPHHILSIFTIITIIIIVIITHLQVFKLLVYKWQTSSTCPETCTRLSLI